MRVNEDSEKAGLKFNTQKTKIKASGLINLWQVEGKKVEAVTDFLFLGSKISADGDCSHEVKGRLIAPWKESYDKFRQCIKKQIYHFANIDWYSQSYGFSSSHVCIWELDQKEGWRMDAFELWCWRRLLRVPWTARESNQSILKEINPEYSLEELMLKRKL